MHTFLPIFSRYSYPWVETSQATHHQNSQQLEHFPTNTEPRKAITTDPRAHLAHKPVPFLSAAPRDRPNQGAPATSSKKSPARRGGKKTASSSSARAARALASTGSGGGTLPTSRERTPHRETRSVEGETALPPRLFSYI